jgi:hypothetical protein
MICLVIVLVALYYINSNPTMYPAGTLQTIFLFGVGSLAAITVSGFCESAMPMK